MYLVFFFILRGLLKIRLEERLDVLIKLEMKEIDQTILRKILNVEKIVILKILKMGGLIVRILEIKFLIE